MYDLSIYPGKRGEEHCKAHARARHEVEEGFGETNGRIYIRV